MLIDTLVSLFCGILLFGELPNQWSVGVIKPLHKRGDVHNPANYRPITLLSCFSKLFTSILNTRLSNFVESQAILGWEQIGFRRGHSTLDHVITLKSIVDIY